MKRLVWSPGAEADLIAIAAYYDEIDPLLADEILHRIETSPLPLCEFDGLGTLTTDGARKWRAPGTPYLLFYDVGDVAIEIVAVRHVRSDYPR